MNRNGLIKVITFVLLLFSYSIVIVGQTQVNYARDTKRIWLDSDIAHYGGYKWKMMMARDVADSGEKFS